MGFISNCQLIKFYDFFLFANTSDCYVMLPV